MKAPLPLRFCREKTKPATINFLSYQEQISPLFQISSALWFPFYLRKALGTELSLLNIFVLISFIAI